MPLFNRVIRALVEKDNNLLITLENFKMSFNVKKTSESTEPNTCSFNIHNLSEDTRNKLNEEDALLTLEAGYTGWEGLRVIFVGDITYTSSPFSPPDRVTSIEAGDGEKALTFTRDSLSFKRGSSIKQILNTIIKKFPIGIKTKLNLISFKDKVLNNGFSFNGTLKKALDILTPDVGLQWSIQNNELKFYNEDGVDLSSAIVINSDTGMIQSPERVKIEKGKKKAKKNIDGWKVTSLLNPYAEPGGLISLSSKEVGDNKLFKIGSVEHVGDNFESTFVTTMEVEEYEQQ